MPHKRRNFISRCAEFCLTCLVRFYQIVLRYPLHIICGPTSGCRFSPSCSHYFLQALRLHGPWRGSWLGVCRICRCHPWGGMGYDPVPPVNQNHPHSKSSQN